MVNRNTDGESHAAVRETAPSTVTPKNAPRQMQVERQGDDSSAYSRRFPEVRGGICEYCGVIDQNYPSESQYKLCEHYRGLQLRCTYCPASKDPDDVINHAVMKVAEHPDNPGKLVVWCDSYDCAKAHLARFKTSVS
jgi:hypothetical protein